jgi:hypothetical protein
MHPLLFGTSTIETHNLQILPFMNLLMKSEITTRLEYENAFILELMD